MIRRDYQAKRKGESYFSLWAILLRISLPLIAFLLYNIVVGGIFKAATGYPHFFVKHEM
jgi:hypothetical protein